MLSLYYENLDLKEKILLYILPLLLIYFININYTKETNTYTKNINIKYNQVDILKYYDKNLEKLKIKKEKLYFIDNTIHLILYSKFNNLIKFINYSKHKIIKYNFYKQNKRLYLDISLNTKQLITVNTNKYKYFKDPFKLKKNKKRKISKAIIGQYVLLNKKWYKLNDTYKNSKIIQINKFSIVLKNKNKTFTMDIFDE